VQQIREFHSDSSDEVSLTINSMLWQMRGGLYAALYYDFNRYIGKTELSPAIKNRFTKG
jgi:hypothetical protein